MMRYRHGLASVAITVLMLGIVPPVRGGLLTSLTVDVAPQPGGLTRYEYTLTNEATSDLSVFQFSLDVALNADLQLLSGPTGWDIIYNPGDSQVIWSSPDSSTDLLPGNGALFDISSAQGPSLHSYLIAGINEAIPDIETNSGWIAGPGVSSVPEPSALMLGSIGVLGLLGYAWRRKHRS